MKRILFMFFFFTMLHSTWSQVDYNKISENLLQAVKDKESSDEYQEMIANVTVEELSKSLPSDQHRIAFWLNVYNAYIQIILRPNPEMYEDKRGFFKFKQIPIAGMKLSFADIEHGIIRGSQNEYFLGYITNLFPDDYEKKLRVAERDFRIHFALNCGANDCPPVAVYFYDDLDYQLDYMSSRYINGYSRVDSEKKEVHTAQLFAWFRGDFGGSSGIRNILQRYGVLPISPRYKMLQRKYDWTLRLDNFVNIPGIKNH